MNEEIYLTKKAALLYRLNNTQNEWTKNLAKRNLASLERAYHNFKISNAPYTEEPSSLTDLRIHESNAAWLRPIKRDYECKNLVMNISGRNAIAQPA